MESKHFPLFAPGDILEIEGIELIDVVLYAVIYGLCRKEGYCFASNDYLSKRLKVCARSIQRSMKRLHGFNLIFAEFDDNNRRIYLKRHDSPVMGGATPESPQTDSSIFLINKSNKASKQSFESEIAEAYKNYPLKKGKTIGVKKLAKQIKSEEDLSQLILAIKNYAAEVKSTDRQYIKHFSTFASCWQDYIEVQTSKKNDFTVVNLLDQEIPTSE
jgi:hypothetical protein